ncbi:5-carboxymethyl-2-hydroxymuconate isomerase [Salipaludibacillus neizhouensis]|uniref:5-carboxymethyl-2-hydroxymuconate isomerase n=1 Tax=Salipaludibacillus neizhouensis TaxID=885475 RepID=A0A3A9K2F7_9BACI|nr:fumarylacetoacetate hydrolase family protein [Salipaludibacillus neizhouensis]RKL66519.1 5-carboxymethyl-2-hydroxymuconate isomerase [Salipaludibacillus neizhouensis]
MKLLTFYEKGELKLGAKTEAGILNIEKAATYFNMEVVTSFEDVIGNEGAIEAFESLIELAIENKSKQLILDEESIVFGPSMPKPGKIVCVGLNYQKHAIESNMPFPEYPILFNKFDNAIAAHNEIINLPINSDEIDYEAELAIVIGKKAKRVKKEEALNYVFGYCNANDLSSRDLQFRTNQWLLGKTCDGFSPLGPYLVTSEEVGDPNDLSIKTTVNGEMRQNSNTSDMIFKCDEIVSYISEYMTLSPGDIILTGTPAGVVFGLPEDKRVYLQDGDEVTINIEKLGKLTNTFKKEV